MIGNKTIVGLVIATMVLSCVAVAVTADEGRVEPMGIFPDSITSTEIGASAVGNSELDASGSFNIAGLSIDDTGTFTSGTGAIALNGDTTVATDKKIQLRDAGIYLQSGVDGVLNISADGAGADAITLHDTVRAVDNIRLDTTKKVEFRDSGIYISSPADGKIEIEADAGSADDILLDGGVTIGGAHTFAVGTGTTTIGGSMDVTGATGIDGDFDIASTMFTVAAATGNTVVEGTTTVTGATALNGGLAMDTTAFIVADGTGDTAIAGTLGVTGKTTVVDFEATGEVTLPSGTAVAHLLESDDTVTSVTGTTYAEPTEVLETTNHITTQGQKNFIITYSANTSVSAGKLIITNISVESSAGNTLKTSTPTNITFADSYATFMQNTIQVFVENVAQGTDMDIVVRARKTGGTVSVQNQTLTVIAV